MSMEVIHTPSSQNSGWHAAHGARCGISSEVALQSVALLGTKHLSRCPALCPVTVTHMGTVRMSVELIYL
jgi:hypothetical protein